jgi:hypothetical protein
VRELRDPEADVVQIEEYIAGPEYALEGLLDNGGCGRSRCSTSPIRSTAVLRRDDLRHAIARAPSVRRQIEDAVGAAVTALGCITARSTPSAASTARRVRARSRGAADRRLVRKALRFDGRGRAHDRLRRVPAAACARRADDRWTREARASAVMMIPIPRSGVYRRVDGVDAKVPQ